MSSFQSIDDLLELIKKDDINALQTILNHQNFDINGAISGGTTLLHQACELGNVNIVKQLLSMQEIDINKLTETGETALYAAARTNNTTVVQLLLSTPIIDINKTMTENTSYYLKQLQQQNDGNEILDGLLSATQNSNLRSSADVGETPIFIAAKNGYLDVVKLLIEQQNLDINCTNKIGVTPLIAACQNNQEEIVAVLLKARNININQQMNDGVNTLILASSQGYDQIVELLLKDDNIQVNQQMQDGSTALFRAVAFNQHKVVKQLLQYQSIDVNLSMNNGTTPLYQAVQQQYLEIVEMLQSHKNTDVNQASVGGATPLSIGAVVGNLQVLQLLLKNKNIDVNKSDNYRATPLFMATQNGQLDSVKLLLKQPNIDVNYAIYDGSTPLYVACKQGFIEITKQLLEHPNINVNQCLNAPSDKNQYEHFPHEISIQHQSINQIEFHQQSLSLQEQSQDQNLTILMKICGYSRYVQRQDDWGYFAEGKGTRNLEENDDQNIDTSDDDLLKLLRIHDVKIYLKYEHQVQYPQIVYVRPTIPNFCEIIKQLLSHKNIQIDQKDSNGRTALFHACKYGHAQFVQLLLDYGANINATIQKQSNQNSRLSNSTTMTVLHEALYTKIERYTKLEVLFSRLDLRVNQKATIQLYYFDQNYEYQNHSFQGNIIIAAVILGFNSDDTSVLKDLLRVTQNSTYTLSVEVDGDHIINNNILYFLIQHKKISLVSQLFQGFVDGQIKLNQLNLFFGVLHQLSVTKEFHPVLQYYIENENIIIHRQQSKGTQTVSVDIGMPIVRFLEQIIFHSTSYDIYRSIIVQEIINKRWIGKAQRYYIFQIVLFMIYMLLIIGAIIAHITWQLRAQDDEQVSYQTVRYMLWVSLPFLILLLTSEILQLDYEVIKVVSNVFDWFIIVVGLLLPFVWQKDNSSIICLAAFFLIILFFRLLIWFLPNRQLGHYILMMTLIAWKTSTFFVIILMMLVFFALSFMLLYQEQSDAKPFDQQFFNTVLGLFGNIEPDQELQSPYKETEQLILIIFLAMVSVLLINLLIALMTSVYEEVAQQRDSAFVRNKGFITLEAHYFLKNLNRLFPREIQNDTSEQTMIQLKVLYKYGGAKSSQLKDQLMERFQVIENKIYMVEQQLFKIQRKLGIEDVGS